MFLASTKLHCESSLRSNYQTQAPWSDETGVPGFSVLLSLKALRRTAHDCWHRYTDFFFIEISAKTFSLISVPILCCSFILWTRGHGFTNPTLILNDPSLLLCFFTCTCICSKFFLSSSLHGFLNPWLCGGWEPFLKTSPDHTVSPQKNWFILFATFFISRCVCMCVCVCDHICVCLWKSEDIL